MKRSIQLSSLAAAVALSAATLAPVTAMAGTSATVGVSNFYLFRGIDSSNQNAQVSGGAAYNHDSGAYAGVWVSSSGVDGAGAASGEYDLYAGFGKEISGIALDANLTSYEYPGSAGAQKLGSYSEVILSASAMGAKLSIADSLQGNYVYYSLGYGMGPVSGLIGFQKNASKVANANDYTHVDLSYALNNELSVTVSQIIDQDTKGTGAIETDPKINLAWTKKFDL